MGRHPSQDRLTIEPDDLTRQPVRELIAEHLADMHATSPAESVHALDHAALQEPEVSFWTSWSDGTLLGCAALKELSPFEGEIKTMRTRREARGRGVASHLLTFLIDESRRRGYHRISLETGSQDFFAPARRLYARHGFTPCPPFADYQADPNSVFMTLRLSEESTADG
ncbi:GNAT family N-acetyltransferase [Prauserella oleivorans]|uniref:GNAT family N-acetyltransferase n=1 Tax=Prauserella oleivorans TaxID=1478153 RepID=A0ABW5WKJ0_9PSEU